MSDPDCAHLIPLVTHLIAIHRAITHKQNEAIAPKLDALMSRIAESLMQIKLQETVWFSARSLVGQQIELLLADDARCLLSIPDFQHFVNDTFGNALVTTVTERGIGIASDTNDWLLQSVSEPLKLTDFRNCNPENPDQYSIQLQLGDCRRVLQVPIAPQPLRERRDEYWDYYFQWQQIGKQLEWSLHVPQFEISEQHVVKREVGCIVCYVAQLLHTVSQIDQFTYP